MTHRARVWLCVCAMALRVLPAAYAAGPSVLEIDSSRFPEVRVTLRLPSEKVTKDLLLDDVRVTEDGAATRLTKYATIDSAALVLVVDRGPGVKAVLPEVREGAQRMLRALGKGPPAALVVAGDPGEMAVNLTRNRGKLDAALDALTVAGGVKLAPALRMAVDEMGKIAAKTKVVLVLTAARDLDARGRPLPDDPELAQVVERARRDQLPLRFILFGTDPDRKRALAAAERTGGAVLDDPSAHEMERIYGDPVPRVEFDLTYESPRPKDFAMRKVAVSFRMFGFEGEVVGYYGDQGQAAGAANRSTAPTKATSYTPQPLLEPEPGPEAGTEEPETDPGAQSDTGQPRGLTLPGQKDAPTQE